MDQFRCSVCKLFRPVTSLKKLLTIFAFLALASAQNVTITGGGVTITGNGVTIGNQPAPPPACTIVTPTPASLLGTAGTPYSLTIQTQTCTPTLTWSFTVGSCPAWATCTNSGSTETISGANPAAGSFPFTLHVVDANNLAATLPLTIAISQPPSCTVNWPAALPDGVNGSPYGPTAAVTGTNCPNSVRFALNSGSLCSWMSLNTLNAQITGTAVSGTCTFTLKETANSPNSVSPTYVVTTPQPPLQCHFVSTPGIPNGSAGTVYDSGAINTNTLANCVTPLSWAVASGSSLPATCTINNASTGNIHCTSPTAGTYQFKLQVTDSATPAVTAVTPLAVSLSITCAPLVWNPGTLSAWKVGGALSQQLNAATGGSGAITYSETGTLPSGITWTAATRTFAGTPAANSQGSYPVTVTATDSCPNGAQSLPKNLVLVVNQTTLTITTTALPNGVVNQPFPPGIGVNVVGGTPPYVWSVPSGTIPTGTVTAPVLFFTDLDSGPATGNTDTSHTTNGGVYVTLYGNFLTGASVTLNGLSCLTTVIPPGPWLWYQRMVVQLGSTCTTGNFVVTTAGGTSNGIPFTVRAGNIYYVATTGNDGNAGTFSSPWLTLQHAADTMAAGDTTYGENGVVQLINQGPSNGSLTLNNVGTSGNPIAIVAYPGATVTVGAPGTSSCTTGPCPEGLYNGGNLPQPSYWTIAELVLRGNDRAVDFNCDETHAGGVCTGYRFIGNDISCPFSSAPGTSDACDVESQTDHFYKYGNNYHDIASSQPNPQAEGMALYFSTDSNFDYIGWNRFNNIMARAAVEIHSTYFPGVHGYNQHDVYIHDNQLSNGCCDGLLISSVSPEQGPVVVYNNLIYNWGVGPLTQNGGSYSCIDVIGGNDNPSNPDTNGTVPVKVYNNTMYNCASGPVPNGAGFIPAAMILGNYSPNLKMLAQDNIVQNLGTTTNVGGVTGQPIPYAIDYFQGFPPTCPTPPTPHMTGDHNLFFGSSSIYPCVGFTSTLTSDPLFISTAGRNFHLQPTSPALASGTATADTQDLDGVLLNGTYPMGAYTTSGNLSNGTAVDLLDWVMMPFSGTNTRYNSTESGPSLYKAYHLDTGLFWWLKGSTGNPWDINPYDASQIYLWITENGDSGQVCPGFANCFLSPTAYKKFLTPVPIAPRYFTLGGADVVINSAGNNPIQRTVNCGTDGQPNINIGNIVGVLHDAGTMTIGSVTARTLIINYYYSLASTTPPYQSGQRERFYLQQGFGQNSWDHATWGGSSYVVDQGPNTTNTIVAGGPPSPSFGCTLGAPPVTGSVPAGLNLIDSSGAEVGTPTTAQTANFQVQVEDAAGSFATRSYTQTIAPQTVSGGDNTYCTSSNTWIGPTTDGPATLPQNCIYTARSGTPSPGKVTFVPSGANLLGVYNAASCGDTLQLQHGGTFSAVQGLGGKGCDDGHWITIETDAIGQLPPEGTRISPCYAGVPSLPGRPAYNCPAGGPQNFMAKIIQTSGSGSGGAIVFGNGVDHIRFIGIEVTRGTSIGNISNLVDMGGNCSGCVSTKIIFDQVWLHGLEDNQVSTDGSGIPDETRTGIGVYQSDHIAVVDSYFNDFYCVPSIGACTEGQAIGTGVGSGANGSIWGVYKIVNNFLEAGGENILSGGGGAANAGFPVDFEIRRNHMFNPFTWMPGSPTYDGGVLGGHPIAVKNILEFKNAARVLLEGNILENIWGGYTQIGPGIDINPGTQCAAAQARLTDFTMRYNFMSRVSQALQIAEISAVGQGITGCPPNLNYVKAFNNVSIHDDVFDHIEYNGCFNCGNYLNEIGIDDNQQPPGSQLHDITINHITQVLDNQPGTSTAFVNGPTVASGNELFNFTWKNSIIPAGNYGITNGGPPTNDCSFGVGPSTPVLSACFTGTLVFGNNMIGWGTGNGGTWASLGGGGALKLTNDQNGYQFVNITGGDYHLQASSPGHAAADDGLDIGANIDLVNTKTQCVTNPGNCTTPPNPLQITQCSPTNATEGVAYSYTCLASGGTPFSGGQYTWSETGSLPAPCTFPVATQPGAGNFSCTPNAGTHGNYPITVFVTDAAGTQTSAPVQLTVLAGSTSVNITTTGVPNGAVNVAYPSTNITAVNGVTPYSWAQTGGTTLSTIGMSLTQSGNNFVLSGTPNAAGNYSITVRVTGADGGSDTASKTFTFQVTNGTQFISSVTLGTPRSNFSGWVGMQFTTGANQLSVSALCRYVTSGNTQTHTAELVQGNAIIAGSSVSIVTNGATPNTFSCTNLSSPITLQANTTYSILDQEFSGGDTWYDLDTAVTTTADASAINTAFSFDNVTFQVNTPTANRDIVPLGFVYGVISGGGCPPNCTGNLSFVKVSTPSGASQVHDFAIIPGNNHWFIADRSSGFYRSADQGATWTNITQNLPPCGWSLDYDTIHSQLIATTSASCPPSVVKYWRSSDEGASWTEIVPPPPYLNSNSAVSADKVLFGTANYLAHAGFWTPNNFACGMWFSTDGGATAQGPINYTLLPNNGTATGCGGGGFSLYYNPIKQDYWMGTEVEGAFRSSDGINWFQVAPWHCPYAAVCDIQGQSDGNVRGLGNDSAGNPLIGGQGGIFRGIGSGNNYTWSPVRSIGLSQGVRTIFVDPNNYLYYGYSNSNGTDQGTIYRSTDNGSTWIAQNSGIPTSSNGGNLEAWHFITNPADHKLYVNLQDGQTNNGWEYVSTNPIY